MAKERQTKMTVCKLLGVIVILGNAYHVDADAYYRCPSHIPRNSYLKTHAGRCYEFFNVEKHWFAAKDFCNKRGGMLITIEERHIQAFVERSLNDLRWPRNGLWIGATDDHREKDWRWVNGARVDSGYSNWDSGQPSCFLPTFLCKEDCACLRLDDSFKWHDKFCRQSSFYYSFICQYEMLPETTTTTTASTTTTTTTSTPSTTSTTSTTEVIPTSQAYTVLVPSLHVIQASTVNLLQSNLRQTNTTSKQSSFTTMTIDQLHRVESQRIVSDEEGVQTGSVVGMVVSFVLIFIAGIVVGVFLCRRRYKKRYEESASAGFNNVLYTAAPQRSKDTNLEVAEAACAAGIDSDQDADDHKYCDIDEIVACSSHVKLPNNKNMPELSEKKPSDCADLEEAEPTQQEGVATGCSVPPPQCQGVAFRQFTPEFLSKDTDVSQAYCNNLYGYHK